MLLIRFFRRLGALLGCLVFDHKPGRYRFHSIKVERVSGEIPVIEYENILDCARCGAALDDRYEDNRKRKINFAVRASTRGAPKVKRRRHWTADAGYLSARSGQLSRLRAIRRGRDQ